MDPSVELEAVQVSVLRSAGEISNELWDAPRASGSPAMSRAFFLALESSGSAGPEQGYQPFHLELSDQSGPLACAPGYVRDRSDGDFSFDWSWARVAEQAGIRWWPKLIWGVPATPFGRYRVLFRPGLDPAREKALLATLLGHVQGSLASWGLGSFQILFPGEKLASILNELGYPAMAHQRFTMETDKLLSFADYLARFDKNQRRNIKRERSGLDARGLVFRTIRPSLLPIAEQSYWAGQVWDRYLSHNEQFGPWSARWLTDTFFQDLFSLAALPSSRPAMEPVIFAAYQGEDPEPLGLSLLLSDGELLMGRYWGSRIHVDELHFELCYYRPIEWAISSGIKIFDPGMGSEHKLRRGFFAEADWSFHYYSDQRLLRFFAENVNLVNQEVFDLIQNMNEQVPFKELPQIKN